MKTYSPANQRYISPERWHTASPSTVKSEPLRATTYEDLIQLKKQYNNDYDHKFIGPSNVSDDESKSFSVKHLQDQSRKVSIDWESHHPGVLQQLNAQNDSTLQDATQQADYLKRGYDRKRSGDNLLAASEELALDDATKEIKIPLNKRTVEPPDDTFPTSAATSICTPQICEHLHKDSPTSTPPRRRSITFAPDSKDTQSLMRLSKSSRKDPAKLQRSRTHIEEQEQLGFGGLTGQQPIGKIDLKNL